MLKELPRTLPNVPWSNFVGLFALVPPSPKFTLAVRELGIDLETPRADLTLDTWRAAINVVREILYPTLPRDQGEFEVGRGYVFQLAESPSGKVMRQQSEGLPPEGILRRFPTQLTSIRPGMQIHVLAMGERKWKLQIEDMLEMPHFAAGALLVPLSFATPSARVVVENRSGDYDLTFSW